GFVSGMGAATADGMYGCIAGLGLSAIADLMVAQSRWLMLIGGLFLCYLGVTTFRQKPAVEKSTVNLSPQGLSPQGAFKSYVSVLFLTLTNPLTIFSFLGIFSGLGLGQAEQNTQEAISLVLGVFLGSALWWLTLSTGVHYISRWFDMGKLVWLNRGSGVVISAFGAIALWRFWHLRGI
ncbi:MAG: LysE family transporter, partial [Leptolyngbyaceae bacterium]|nr:LysE family transporter [Leptolyngbyaceae bacterium]